MRGSGRSHPKKVGALVQSPILRNIPGQVKNKIRASLQAYLNNLK
jgi:hypothetical protein